MSLINDALKKTQQARATAQGDGKLMDSPSASTNTATKTSPWPWIFGMVALIVLATPLSIWLITSNSQDTPAAPSPAPAETPKPQSTLAQAEPASANFSNPEKNQKTQTPAASEQTQPSATPATAKTTTPSEPDFLAKETDTVEGSKDAPSTSPPTTPEPQKTISANAQIVELLKTIKVTGLLLSNDPNESKIMLDGAVYSVNGIIDYQLGCKIAEIRKNAVVFTDESGVRYTKRF